MRSSIIIFVVLVSLLSLVEAANKVKTPSPVGICKKFPIKANGTQIKEGFCSSQIVGEVPSIFDMVSTIIELPQNGQVLEAKKKIQVKVKVANLITGFFSDPENDYYDLPQTLSSGKIKGHIHITVQKLFGNDIPNPVNFEFFEGLNEKASGRGELTTVIDGLKPGNYRLCTLSSSESHQPVVMPVAKRGAQDDCIRFSVK